ncbi:MAG: hypothetical protein ACRDYA_20120 [Egibacteraceae bacterium]
MSSSPNKRACCAGGAGTADVVDATLIVSAARRNDDVLTSDSGDLARLAVLSDGVGDILDLTRLPER